MAGNDRPPDGQSEGQKIIAGGEAILPSTLPNPSRYPQWWRARAEKTWRVLSEYGYSRSVILNVIRMNYEREVLGRKREPKSIRYAGKIVYPHDDGPEAA